MGCVRRAAVSRRACNHQRSQTHRRIWRCHEAGERLDSKILSLPISFTSCSLGLLLFLRSVCEYHSSLDMLLLRSVHKYPSSLCLLLFLRCSQYPSSCFASRQQRGILEAIIVTTLPRSFWHRRSNIPLCPRSLRRLQTTVATFPGLFPSPDATYSTPTAQPGLRLLHGCAWRAVDICAPRNRSMIG